MPLAKLFRLSSGHHIPAIGFGTWDVLEAARPGLFDATRLALKCVWLLVHRHRLALRNRETRRRSNPRKRDLSARALYHNESVSSLQAMISDAKLESYA